MAVSQNIESYVRWRGDLSFEESPFTAVDNLVFSKLAYYDFSGVPQAAGQEGLALRECPARADGEICLKGVTRSRDTFFSTCARSRRFGGATLRNYVDIGNVEDGIQFCAMEFVLSDGLSYLSFRGTDNTLVGWREDFDISYRRIASQKQALAYLNQHLREGRRYLVGGHSKGANLALFATVRLGEKLWRRVSHVYLNDGPGLRSDVVDIAYPSGYRRRVTRILPAHSVFGRLFEPTDLPKTIVSTSVSGLFAHELLTWEVADGGLARVPAHDMSSERVAAAFAEWMEHATPRECEVFVNEFFRALEASGAQRTTELGACGVAGFEEILQSLAGAKGTAKATFARLPLGIFFGNALRKARRSGPLMWLLRDDLAHNLCLVVLGVVFLLARGSALHGMASLLLFVLSAALVLETVLRLRSIDWNVGAEVWRINVSLCVSVLFLTSLAKEEALFIYGSTVFGIVLTAISLFYGNRQACRGGPLRALDLGLSMLFGISAFYVLVAPAEAMGAFTVALGILLLAAGCVGIVDLALQQREPS